MPTKKPLDKKTKKLLKLSPPKKEDPVAEVPSVAATPTSVSATSPTPTPIQPQTNQILSNTIVSGYSAGSLTLPQTDKDDNTILSVSPASPPPLSLAPSPTSPPPPPPPPPPPSLPRDIFPEIPPLKHNLRFKITLSLFIVLTLPIAVGIIINSVFHLSFGYLIIVFLVSATVFGLIATSFTKNLLKPLDIIYDGLHVLLKGQYNHLINIKSKDELEDIANLINNLTKNLEGNFEQVSLDKNLSVSKKNQLDQILSTLKEGILVIDQENKVSLMNQPGEKLTGWSALEVKGRPVDEVLILSDLLGQPFSSKEYLISDSKNPEAVNFESNQMLELLNKAGTRIAIKLFASSISPTDKNALTKVIVLRNVQKQKEFESMQLDFVSMASHELRTPLTSIKGYLSVFLDENKSKLSKEQNEFLEKIMISTQQLEVLVNNLLAVSKVERGAIALNTQSSDWQQILTKAVGQNTMQASQKNIVLKLDKLGELPNVAVDVVRITEVVNNLISNAINYTQEGGKITVSCKVEGREVITSIQDNGRGIGKDDLSHLFTKFFRVQGALDQASNSKGTGLGLYLSKSIIDLHHGKIWVESPGLGQGSTFSFSLPASEKKSVREDLAPLERSQFTNQPPVKT